MVRRLLSSAAGAAAVLLALSSPAQAQNVGDFHGKGDLGWSPRCEHYYKPPPTTPVTDQEYTAYAESLAPYLNCLANRAEAAKEYAVAEIEATFNRLYDQGVADMNAVRMRR